MTVCGKGSTQNVVAPNYVTVHKEEREQVKFVAPPKEILLSFLCVQFLTNYDVRKRKQNIGLTKTNVVSCELKTNF